jgi:putative flippase GtrA
VQPLLRFVLQYARFGAVGLTAAATHVLIFSAGIQFAGLAPLVANCIAFSMAVLVSFLGHFRWTFRDQTAGGKWHQQRAALIRFTFVALTGFALNSLAVYVVVNVMLWPYYFAIILMLTAVPVVVFALSKFWAFAAAAD